MKKNLSTVIVLVGLSLLIAGSTLQARRGADINKSPVYINQPQPEVNPWADKGIASNYAFGAYYTRKHVDEKWHLDSRTDQWSDIMVKFGNGPQELVFWRGSSYLPYWNTGKGKYDLKEIVKRSGDGSDKQPDKVNRYSRARVIESTDKRAVIHWRYMPTFTTNVGPNNMPDQTRMVDEYFVIYPDRSVVRAVLEGQSRYEDWRSSAPGKLFRYMLTDKGAEEKSAQSADRKLMLDVMGFSNEKAHQMKPVPVIAYSDNLPAPIVRFNFDEGKGLITTEAVSGDKLNIQGHAAHWRGGVSGTALMFDGWTSQVEQNEKDLSDKVKDKITLDAWISIAAYPWNTCPIIQQVLEEDDRLHKGVMLPKQTKGVMLAMEADGKPSLWLMINGKPITIKAEDALIPRFRWTRLTAVIDTSDNIGKVMLYIDGKVVAEKTDLTGKLELANGQPIRVGQGIKRLPYLQLVVGNIPPTIPLKA